MQYTAVFRSGKHCLATQFSCLVKSFQFNGHVMKFADSPCHVNDEKPWNLGTEPAIPEPWNESGKKSRVLQHMKCSGSRSAIKIRDDEDFSLHTVRNQRPRAIDTKLKIDFPTNRIMTQDIMSGTSISRSTHDSKSEAKRGSSNATAKRLSVTPRGPCFSHTPTLGIALPTPAQNHHRFA